MHFWWRKKVLVPGRRVSAVSNRDWTNKQKKMKHLLFAAFLLLTGELVAQVLIHSHNDYEKPEPLFAALREKAFAIEADVYLVNGQLAVAHDRKDIDPKRNLI